MSSPKRKNAHADLMTAFESGVPWGNIVNMNKTRRLRKSSPAVWNINAEALEDYIVPDLRLRKAIWETFPVDLKPIVTRDGTDRYAIVWNQKKLKEWRETRAETHDEYMDYADYQAARLLYALKQHSRIYRLEPARSAEEIAIIAMVHGEPVRGSGSAAASRRDKSRSRSPKRAPRLMRLTDIRDVFPDVVVWKSVEGRRGESTYALTVMNKFLKAVPPRDADRVLGNLMAALRASSAWHVIRPIGDEFARLEMRHD